jgi:uroporphyrinogen decarboxylase
MTCFFGGSLFGRMRNWMGMENVSYLPYDDPELYEEIISFMADYFIRLNGKFIERADFDFAYFFEDCCFNTGPMISPEIYRRFYDKHYRRMFDFYRSKGIKWMLIDSDGKVDDLVPCWLESGFDIVFPVEIGTWKADPLAFRKKYGRKLRMMGGVNKHVIAQGEDAIRKELTNLKPLVDEGGFIPLPDHRIPPDVSLEQMKTYVNIFQEIFNSNGNSQ